MKAAEKDDWGTAGQIIQSLQFTVENKDARIAEMKSIITDCQDILGAYLPPDGPSAKDTISMLLEILDGSRARAALNN